MGKGSHRRHPGRRDKIFEAPYVRTWQIQKTKQNTIKMSQSYTLLRHATGSLCGARFVLICCSPLNGPARPETAVLSFRCGLAELCCRHTFANGPEEWYVQATQSPAASQVAQHSSCEAHDPWRTSAPTPSTTPCCTLPHAALCTRERCSTRMTISRLSRRHAQTGTPAMTIVSDWGCSRDRVEAIWLQRTAHSLLHN